MTNAYRKPIDEAGTPAEMRAAIFKYGYDDALTNAAMTSADRQGLSAEDRYTTLAYHALRHRHEVIAEVYRQAEMRPTPQIIVEHRTKP